MSFINRLGFLASGAAALVAVSAPAASAEPDLVKGDSPATVTVGDRPLTGPADHVAAFTRGGVLYVGLEELTRVVTGTITKSGGTVTITSFRGAPDSKTAVFHIGSPQVSVGGKIATLDAPVIEAYGHRPYVPLSFFGTKLVRTTYKEAADHRSGAIILPSGM
jgi:hypothetical protein